VFRLRACTAVLCLLSIEGTVHAASLGAPVPEAARPLFHGNWCGAGDANRAAPVDAFDAACRAHDLCYERVGRGACSCDRAFLQATAALVKGRKVPETVRSKAATANSLFSATLCTEPEKTGRNLRQR
jgi:hypothetical protein